MPLPDQWPVPEWLAELPDDERHKALVRYMLCLAVAYMGDKASPGDLSRALGMHHSQVNLMKHRGTVAGETAVKLEALLGRKLFPRELFRPDLFTLPAE
jgi:hypothetical protein